MSRLSIRLRVTLVFTAVMALVLAATGLFVYLRLGSDLDNSIDQDLRDRTRNLAAEIRVSDRGLGEAARATIGQGGETFAQVLTPSGRLFDPNSQPSVPPALELSQVDAALRGPATFERSGLDGFRGEKVRLMASPITFEGQRLVLVAGDSLAERDDALTSLARLLLIGGPIALALAALAGFGVVTAALRPVEAMRRRAAEISTAEADQRLPLPRAHDELHRLGATLNEMLGRLNAAIERERQFVDDASHELRTPLATHKTELELALRQGREPEELRAAIASAIEDADRVAQLAEDLLVIARSDKGRLAVKPQAIEIGTVLRDVADRFQGRADSRGRVLSVESTDGRVVEVDRVRLEQALSNLVDNALRHGEGTVRLWARDGDGRVELHVTDAGSGFPSEFLPRAFERFSRAESARAEGGTGLGLAIVEAIAEAHHGRAVAVNAPDGGADVWIELDGRP